MEYIKMNAQRAKKIGAFPHKEIEKRCKPGDIIINVSTGAAHQLPKSREAFAKEAAKFSLRGTYYKRAADCMKYITMKGVLTALEVDAAVTDAEEQLDVLENRQDSMRAMLQRAVLGSAKDVVVLFYRRKGNETVAIKDVQKILRKGDKLLSFGRRIHHKPSKEHFNEGESLWIALVEIPGLVTLKVTSHYGKGRWDFKTDKADSVSRLSDTGFKPGDDFGNGVGYIVFNHGKALKKPLDLNAAKEKEQKKVDAQRKIDEENRWKNVKTTEAAPTKTKIFMYRGWLGIQSCPTAEGIIAKPGGDNLGTVVRTDACEITPEAKQVFAAAGREGGSFAPFMLTKHDKPTDTDGKSSIGWMGGYQQACKPNEVVLGRDCDKEVLGDMTLVQFEDMELPKGFVEFVDKQISKIN